MGHVATRRVRARDCKVMRALIDAYHSLRYTSIQMTTTSDIRLPFELRIHALESRIFGTALADRSTGATISERSITRRIEDIEEAIERTARGSEALRRLIDGCK